MTAAPEPLLDPEQSHFARRWTLEDLLPLRSQDDYGESSLSNVLSRKLRTQFRQHAEQGTAALLSGISDSVMANEFVEAGAEALFVSGALASLTETPNHDCGADLVSDPPLLQLKVEADYTYDTVPKRVEAIVQNQMHWSRVDRVRGHTRLDRMVPVIADADSGHGNATSTMKLVRLLVKAGCAGFHIDDLLSGEKFFDGGAYSHVIVPWSEHARRLLAAKLQLDICKSHAVLIARTDSETANRITSTIDPVDRPFILGRTIIDAPSLVTSLADGTALGADLMRQESEWDAEAKLMTLDEYMSTNFTAQEYQRWRAAAHGKNVADSLLEARTLDMKVMWDAEGCRNRRGWYRYRGSIESGIARSICNAPLADIVWSCTNQYNKAEVQRYAREVHAAVPGKWLGYNWSSTQFDLDRQEIEQLVTQLGSLGYVFQTSPFIGVYAEAAATRRIANSVREKGVFALLEAITDARRMESSTPGWYASAGSVTDRLQQYLS